MVYRRFGYLQARILLDKQEELRLLEEELEELDEIDEGINALRLRTRDLGEDEGRPRRELLQRIETAFCQYGNIEPLRESTSLLTHF